MRTKCEFFHVLSHATGFYSYRNYMLLFWRHLPINNNAHNDKVWTNLFCLRIHHCIGAIEKYSLRMCQYLQFVWNLWVVRCLQPLKNVAYFDVISSHSVSIQRKQLSFKRKKVSTIEIAKFVGILYIENNFSSNILIYLLKKVQACSF